LDIGLLILRVVVGALFIGHGTQKLFGWFGGHGPEGTGQFLQSLGYAPGRPAAILTGIAEAGGGTLLALGFLTPLGAAAIIGVMMNATVAVHLPKGLWNTEGGFELPLVYSAAAAALAFVGPGRYSVDHALGWDLSGMWYGLGAIALGLLAASIVLLWRNSNVLQSQRAGRRRRQAA
jgi:putative oxidoreductase